MLSDHMPQSLQIYFWGVGGGEKKILLQATLLLLVSNPVILTDSRRETVG